MKLLYGLFDFSFHFERPVFFDVYPSFLFRSLLGKELRKMSCVFHGRKCVECGLREQCVYSRIFETPIPKENPFLTGRNKAPHPFVFDILSDYSKPTTQLRMRLNLFGEANKLLPYFYYALREAGKSGVLKSRIPYTIESLSYQGRELIQSDGNIDTDFEPKQWNISENKNVPSESHFNMSIQSPLRLQVSRQIVTNPHPSEILKSIYNRMKVLTELYGIPSENNVFLNESGFEIIKQNFSWQNLKHYSARQKRVVTLGGVVGNGEFEAEMDPIMHNLFRAAELFHVGKNISFGLGNVKTEAVGKLKVRRKHVISCGTVSR